MTIRRRRSSKRLLTVGLFIPFFTSIISVWYSMTGILSTERNLKTNTAIRKFPYISLSLPPPSSSAEMINSVAEGRGEGKEGDDGIIKRKKGFAACILILDDTIRLHEWIAYHYTILPLTSLVIGYDQKTSNESLTEFYSMANNWNNVGLNITIWSIDSLPDIGYTIHNKIITTSSHPNVAYVKRQMEFVTACTNHFRNLENEKWLLLTDTDEFLFYNTILPSENISHYDPKSIFTGKFGDVVKKKIPENRAKALPIRKKLITDYIRHNKTILTFIEEQQQLNLKNNFHNGTTTTNNAKSSDESFFPSSTGCNRIVGLRYGSPRVAVAVTNNNNNNKPNKKEHEEILMTKNYQSHPKELADNFSKVFLELPKLRGSQLTMYETIHNPFPKACGKNGKWSTGQDFISSVLKIAHFVGTLESYVERDNDDRTRRGTNLVSGWEKMHDSLSPYEDILDTNMGYWLDLFLLKVGNDTANRIFLEPLKKRIDIVRRKHNISEG